MIRDVYNPQDAQKAMSRVMMLFVIAPAIAPVIGGWLHDAFGWHSVFHFLAFYSSFVFFLVLIYIPETLPPSDRQSFRPADVTRVYKNTLVHRRFQTLVFIVSCYFAGMFLYIAGAPTVIFDFLNLESNDFGLLFIPMVGGMMLGAWLSGWLAHRWPAEQTVQLALIVITLAAIFNASQSLWLTPTIFTLISPMVIYSFGIGIAMPAMTVLVLDCFPKNRGTASAVQGFVQMLGNALIASLAVPLLSSQPSDMAFGQLALIIVALILWWRIPSAEEPVRDD